MPEYAPDGATLERFLQSDAFVRGLMGPVRGGKSTACAVDLLDKDFDQAPGSDGVRRTRTAVVRNTYPELRTTTLQTIRMWVDPGWCQVVMGSPIELRMRARLEDGSRVESDWYLISLDRDEDIRKLLGLEATNAWLNEARELPRQVLMRMTERVDQYPPRREGGATHPCIVMDTNPPDTEHWWYELAEVSTPEGWEFFRQPSGRGPDAENLSWVPPGYYERMVQGKSPDEVRVYVDGEYGYVQDGTRVYEAYQDWLHCGDEELPGDRSLPVMLGLDFGWSAAAVIGQRDGHGRWQVLDELVSETLGTHDFAAAVVQKLNSDWQGFRIGGVWGDPSGGSRSPHVSADQPNTHVEICRAAGLPVMPAPSNDLRLRIDAVSKLLSTLAAGRPRLRVSRRAVDIRKGFNGRYRWPPRTVGGNDQARGTKPVPNRWEHPHDALQYMVLGAGEGRELTVVERPKVERKGPARRYGEFWRSGRAGR